ncbi:CHASE4 domain-containing protein [Chloroflexota bacterium]
MGLTLILLIAILYGTARITIFNSFSHVEENDTSRNVNRALSALANEISALDTTTYDWAAWDDTYEFIEDANNDYVESNLVDGTFIDLSLNLMLFVDTKGHIIFEKAFDLLNEEEIQIPPSLQQHLTVENLLLNHTDTESNVDGIISLSESPMLIASRPILTSNDEGPILGTLIMGRHLDNSEIQSLAETTHLSLTTQPYDDPQMPSDFQEALSTLSDESSIAVQPLSAESVAGYTLLTDIYGNPVLLLRVDMPRDIYQQGQRSLNYLLLSLIVISIVFGALILFVLERLVLSRLSRLNNNVTEITSSADHSARIKMTGDDELSSLGNRINNMLDRMQDSYEKEQNLRQEREQEIEKRVEFTRALVHELKTPLTPILASSDLLIEETQDENLLALAKNIHQGANTLNKRIDELLDMARGELGILELQCKEIDLLLLLNDIAGELKPVASSRDQMFNLEMPPSLPSAEADEDRLRQVLLNLLDNAIKFTPSGGTITLRAREKDGSLIIEVQDTGPGISEEKQQQVFEAYYRVKGERQRLHGLGLGLSLCKLIVELHGGRIWLESQDGEGTTFAFSLPLK